MRNVCSVHVTYFLELLFILEIFFLHRKQNIFLFVLERLEKLKTSMVFVFETILYFYLYTRNGYVFNN